MTTKIENGVKLTVTIDPAYVAGVATECMRRDACMVPVDILLHALRDGWTADTCDGCTALTIGAESEPYMTIEVA